MPAGSTANAVSGGAKSVRGPGAASVESNPVESSARSNVEKAHETRDRVNLDFVVGNDADVMGDDRTRALLVRAEGDGYETVEGTKADLGARVADELAAVLD